MKEKKKLCKNCIYWKKIIFGFGRCMGFYDHHYTRGNKECKAGYIIPRGLVTYDKIPNLYKEK
ncbi:MAG: hypothetical protein U9Q21_04440 [Candidatus Auribacterota bacterium]|nr:hypothetical protein [Candidatus Auribacterota bacterium]